MVVSVAMKLSRSSLFFHADFRRLWSGDSISQIGSAVTLIALPLVAIRTLHATPLQAGLLVTCEYLAFLIIGLPAGAWVDRMRHRRVMIVADIGRAALLGSIPVAGYLGRLSLLQLYVVTFAVSVCTAFFDVAYQSYLPNLVHDEQLVEGNVKLEVTRNVAQVGGPGLGGFLIAAFTAPLAIAVNVATFLASAAFLSRIRRADARPEAAVEPNLWAEIGEGLRFVFGHRLLRAITLTGAISNLCGTIGSSMLLMLLAGQLRLPPLLCGIVFSAEAVGGLIGALLATRIVAKLGQGPAICASVTLSGVLWLLALPLFQTDWRLATAVVLHGLGWVVFMTFKISAVSLRQGLCPKPLLGRMTATVRFVIWGAMPIGALLGGFLGQTIGVRQAMWVGVVGELCAVLPILFSPLRAMREAPAVPAEEPIGAAAAA